MPSVRREPSRACGGHDFTCYPDASVVCGKLETNPVDHNAALNTILVAEVLSDWTEAYDRGVKASHYRPIPAIREYVLVSQHSPLIEVWRKNDQARWELAAVAGKGEHAELPTAEGWLARGMLRAREVHGSPPPQSADPGRGRRSRHDGL